MQHQKTEHHGSLIHITVRDLTADKRRLVEVPYTATLAHAMNALVANCVAAAPVAAPPGHWIGAGGSMIMESDKQTGAVRKHYIGMVITMLDILAHIAGDDQQRTDGGDTSDLDQKMSSQVSSIIGHCLEGLSLWALNPNSSILDCMEVFSKGIHRALVPMDSNMENISGVELVESASGYRMLTQMDLLRFLRDHASELKDITSLSISELGAMNECVYAITEKTTVFDAIKCMRSSLLSAVPIVQAPGVTEEDHRQLINGRQRRVIGTFSATDLRACRLSVLQTWLPQRAVDFTEKAPTEKAPLRELVACRADSSLADMVETAVAKHVHRVWVLEEQDLLQGVVSLTDILRTMRSALISMEE